MLLGSSDNINNPQDTTLADKTSKKKTGLFLAIAIAVAVAVIIGAVILAVFYDGYPISCDKYEGSSDGQNECMEESRVGICDLIRCLKEFVKVENMECDFSDFDFVNF